MSPKAHLFLPMVILLFSPLVSVTTALTLDACEVYPYQCFPTALLSVASEQCQILQRKYFCLLCLHGVVL